MTAPERYAAALHGIQTGIAYKLSVGLAKDCEPKHLRVGVNSAMLETSAIVRLLIAKGVITTDEWWEALATEAEKELARYEAEIGATLR